MGHLEREIQSSPRRVIQRNKNEKKNIFEKISEKEGLSTKEWAKINKIQSLIGKYKCRTYQGRSYRDIWGARYN